MKRIETNNFVLTQELVESDGECTWIAKEQKTGNIFYIHVFQNNRLNIKLFNSMNYVHNPSEAISALCNNLIDETNITPSINIFYKNISLIKICTKAGFRKNKNKKHLYIFKRKHENI